MKSNFKWHYMSNMENMPSNQRPLPTMGFLENHQTTPQHHHSQFLHYPQQMPSNASFQPPSTNPHLMKILPENYFQPRGMNEMQFMPRQSMPRPQRMQQPQFYLQHRQPHRIQSPVMPQYRQQQFQYSHAVLAPPMSLSSQMNVQQMQRPPEIHIPEVIEEEPLELKSPILNFDFDFPIDTNADEELDINHFLMLDFADEPEINTRKRKTSDNSENHEIKRSRRSRAQIISDRNLFLMQQCKPCAVSCPNLDVPKQVRVFGNAECRERSVRVHRMKLSPTNEEFLKIKNIGYLRTSNGIAYGCFIGSCRFKSYDFKAFENHLNAHHTIEGAGSREGYCQICEKNCCGFCLTDELAHMQLHHINVPYSATHLILYSKINTKIVEKSQERQELKITLKRPEILTSETFPSSDEFSATQETIDDGNDDDYHPESEPDTEEEEDEEEEEIDNCVESELEETESVASSDMESEDLDDENQELPLDDQSTSESNDSDENELMVIRSKSRMRDRKRKKRKKSNFEISNLQLNLTPISKSSSRASLDDDDDLLDKVPEYMLQRIKQNASTKGIDDKVKEIPKITESFIEEMLQSDTESKKVTEEKLPRCSVRLQRLESSDSLKEYLAACDDSRKLEKKNLTGIDSLKPPEITSKEPNKNVVLDIPTPPASEDSRDSMSSPRDENKNQKAKIQPLSKFEQSIERISKNILAKIPSEETSVTRKSLRLRAKSISVTRILQETQQSARSRRKSFNLVNENCAEVLKIIEESKIRSDENSEVGQNIEELPPENDININSEEIIEVMSSQEELEELVNIPNLYPWIHDRYSSKVLKTRKCLAVLQSEYCKFSTYKCMKETCSFFTIDFTAFQNHAKKHDGHHNFCSFCLFDGYSGEELSDHLEIHKFDRYQCGKCMYRSCKKSNVDLHRKHFHAEETVDILKSPVQYCAWSDREMAETKIKEENWSKFVLPYECSTPFCTKKFFSKKNYLKHLTDESNRCQGDATMIRKISEQIIAIDHQYPLNRKKETKEGRFQCLYCIFGADIVDDIFNHLANYHAQEMGFYCQRDSNNDSQPETLETHTQIITLQHENSIAVKLFGKKKMEELSTHDHLPDPPPTQGSEEIIPLDEDSSSSDALENNFNENRDVKPSVPIISEVNYIDSY